jgi:uncharacterized protein
MDFDSAVASLRTSCGCPPASALRAAAECPGELVAAVSAVLELGATGELLIPEEEHLLFSGLYVLAEGRRCEVLPLLCRFLRASPGIVEGVFDEDFTHLNGILYSLGAEDAGPLFELGADAEAQDDARGAAISALGRLVAEDGADRDRFVQLLDGFDRTVESPAGEWAYCSWAEAIFALQLREFIPRVRTAFEAGLLPWADEDWEELLADPDHLNPSLLAVPVEDARAALDCFSRPTTAESDEIAPGRLAWLDHALWQGFGSAGAEQCMPLEVVDGFFTGVLSGPEPRPSFEGALPSLLPQLGDVFGRSEVRREIREALHQLFDTIEYRLARGIPPEPWITDTGIVKRGELWAMGFMRAMTLDKAGWEPLLNHRVAEPLLAPMLFLAGELKENRGRDRTTLRDDLCDNAGELALEIHSFWRGGPSERVLRALDVGRNEPCPCGSGKKFKKCCGTPASRQGQRIH